MSFFSKIIQDFDQSNDLADAQREALEALYAVAEAKRQLFTEEIKLLALDAGTGTNKTVPISLVERSSGQSRAYTSSSAKDIGEILKTSIGGFIDGGTDKVLDGVFSILTRTLEIFLGSTEGQEMTKVEYFVYMTEFSIYRIDLMAWSRSVKATSLKTKIEQSTAYAYSLSIVDIERIKWQDFVGIFALQLKSISTITDTERDAAKARMTSTWNFLKGPAGTDLADADVRPDFARIENQYHLPLSSYNASELE
jgi:hypothetical protein